MADKTSIAFGLKIDGVEQSIKSVKDLKSAIKELQDEAENSDLGSEQYKNAIEQIEKLNEKLQEVTQTEKQRAQSIEDLAKSEKEAVKETQDLRKQFEVLEDQLFLLAGQGKQNTKEFRDLSAEAAKLNGKIDQVNQTLGTGASGVDKLSGSFGMLSEGLTSMNFDKVKAGFKGIGQAMSAVPLMLLVTGITMLAEKFELFKIIGEAVEKVFYAITDAMGLTSKAADEQTAAILVGMQKQQDAINARYDKEIKLAKAAGKDTILMEIEKSKSVEASAFSELNILSAKGRKKKKFNEEEQKQYDELQKALYDAQLNRQLLETALEKKKQDEQKALDEKSAADKIAADAKATERAKKVRDANLAMIKQIEDAKIAAIKDEELRAFAKEVLDNERRVKDIKSSEASAKLKKEMLLLNAQQYEDNLAKINADGAAKRKAEEDKINADRVALNKQMLDQKHAQQIAQDEIDGAAMVAKAEKEKQVAQATEDAKYKLAENGISSLQNLSDIYFLFKTQNLEKGSKAELDAAKKQFNVNKALQIASATIAGVQGVQNALTASSILPEPLATAFRVANAVTVGIASAANIAKIAASKFEGGGGGATGGGGGAAPMPSIPAPPTIATSSNNTNQSTTFDESGKNLEFKQPQINVTATVGVDEIASKSNRVSVLENQSTF